MRSSSRRRFVGFGIGGLASLSLPAFAQSPPRPLVGFLGAESEAGYARQVEAFRAGMRNAGYLEGKNVTIEYRWAEARYERLPELAAELVRLKPDVIVTHGSPGTNAAKKATSTIPIVMAASGDAVAMGFARNLARPGGNITGSTFIVLEIGPKRLDLLKAALPAVSRVAYIYNPENPSTPQILAAIDAGARSLNLKLDLVPVQTFEEIERGFETVVRQRTTVMMVPEYSLFIAQAKRVAGLATKHRIATVGFSEFADAGGLIGYGINTPALFRRAADYVDRILKGAKPGDLPIERASTFELVVNRITAKTLGLALPQAILLRADRVIE
jgi:putative ABC transport system substrate-binding protein